MKKATKILITAAAVAAVAGVSAVSFAAWSAGSVTPVGVTGAAGSINTVGSLSVTTNTADSTLTNMKALFPVDQGDDYLTYWEFVVTVEGEGDQTVKLKGGLTQTTGNPAVDGAQLYWSSTVPTSSSTGSDATKIDASTAKAITLGTDNKVYVYMVAGTTEKPTEGMKASISLTFSAEAA